MIVIGHGIHDSYLGSGITILYVLSFFLSFIATGLAMCKLGGVISAQKVLF